MGAKTKRFEWAESVWNRVSYDGRIDYRPYVYLLPALLLYFGVLVYPFIQAFILSFQEVLTLGGARRFVGLENYLSVLRDPIFWLAMKNTLIFSIGMVFIPIVLGLGLALLIDRELWGRSTLRSLIFMPTIVPIVVAGIVFSWILQPDGVLNWFLLEIGVIQERMRFLNSPTLALPSIMVMVVWKRTGYYMVIILAGLQSIPDDVYEAAKIMGKSRLEMFRHITLPLLKPALLITAVIGVIDTIKAFAHVDVLTQGGPAHASEVLSTHFYQIAFTYYQFGKGAAYGFILFAMALTLSLIVIRFSGGSEI